MARKSRKNIMKPISTEGVSDGSKIVETSAIASILDTKKLRTAAYIRLSVENNGHDTEDSIQTQMDLVVNFIQEHTDLQLIDTFVDNGYSGTKFDRPEFVRMMDCVKSGKIECIVVKDLSRFGRDYLETGYYLETIFPLLNVRFIAVTDNFDSIREADRNSLSVPIKNMVNAMYAKDYSRKQEVFREMCKTTGRVMGINAPYGYKYLPDTQKLVIDEVVEPYVRMIFAWTLAGVKRIEIAKRMQLIGAPTPGEYDNRNTQKKWVGDTVKLITYNPAYAGFHVMGKSKLSLYKGINKRIDRNEWLYFPDFHEPYITVEDYEQIEKTIFQNKKEMEDRLKVRAAEREKLPDYFPGMVYCADCGRRMGFYRGCHHRGYTELTFQYYRCKYSKEFAQCSNKKIQQNFLIVVVTDQIRNLIQLASDKKQILKDIQSGAIKANALDMLKRNISRLMEQEQNLEDKMMKAYMDYADQLLDADDYRMVKEKMIRDRQEKTEKRETLEQKLMNMELAVKKYQEFVDGLEEYLQVPEFNPTLVKELVNKIWVSDDGRVEIEFKCQDIFQNDLVLEFMGEKQMEEYEV
ncbi:MAG: recombinase family protein [Lachnospiraceae bacterium]|nr:recombinase family protein [Lachnospiraceae bacterium]